MFLVQVAMRLHEPSPFSLEHDLEDQLFIKYLSAFRYSYDNSILLVIYNHKI